MSLSSIHPPKAYCKPGDQGGDKAWKDTSAAAEMLRVGKHLDVCELQSPWYLCVSSPMALPSSYLTHAPTLSGAGNSPLSKTNNNNKKKNSTHRYNRKFFLVRTNLLPHSLWFLVLSLGATDNKSILLSHKTVLLIVEDCYLSPLSLFFSYTALFFQISRFHFPIAIQFFF